MTSFSGIKIPAYWNLTHHNEVFLWAELDWKKAQIMRLPDFTESFAITAMRDSKTGQLKNGTAIYGVAVNALDWNTVTIDRFTSVKTLREWLTNSTQPDYENSLLEEIRAARFQYQIEHLS